NAIGSAFADKLTGNAGSNLLDGGAGADVMAGGAGGDVYIVDDAGDGGVEQAEAGGLVLPLDIGMGPDNGVASVNFSLGKFAAKLDLSGNANLEGIGNELDNIINGNGGANVLSGLAGNDRITGGGGDDTMDGGTGTDTAVYTGAAQNYRIERVGSNWKLT